METVITAKNYGFLRILLLTNKKNLDQLLHRFKNPAWHERSLIGDMEILYQSGLVCNLLVVPKCVLGFVFLLLQNWQSECHYTIVGLILVFCNIDKLCIFFSWYKKKNK